MNTLRFGKIVEDPDVAGIRPEDQVDIPSDLASQLEQAIRDGDKSQLEVLLARLPPGANLEHCPTRTGTSLLHIAAELGFTRCANALIEIGKMDPSYKLSSSLIQPIHMAAKGGHQECLFMLINKGVDKNAITIDGETPLHLLASPESAEDDQPPRSDLHVAAIQKLVGGGGVDVNARDKSERTPIHYAAKAGDGEIIKALVKLGADPTAKDVLHQDAASIAEENGHIKLSSALRSKTKSAKSSSSSKGEKDKNCVLC